MTAPPAQTLLGLWQRAAGECPASTFAICDDRSYTYAAIDAASSVLAAALRKRAGLQPRDVVALLVPNSVEFIIAYVALMKAGCVALPVNIRLAPDEIRFILDDGRARALFVHAATRAAAESLPSPDRRIAIAFTAPGHLDFSELITGPADLVLHPPAPTDTAAVIYTSGTTGRPKGAMLSHANIVFNAVSAELGLGFRPDDRHMLAVPLFHVTGLNTIFPATLLHKSSVVITASASPAEQLALVERHRATTLLGVPTTYIMLAGLGGLDRMDLRRLRLIGYSGAPMPAEAIAKLHERFPWADLHNFYGLTETTSIASVLPAANALSHAASIGRRVPRVDFMIADDSGRALPVLSIGELCIRGGNVFAGYLNRPDATREAFFGDWFRSGDLALIDPDGFVFLQGRKKEMIIVGGENVYPVEVENVLCSHPAVREAAVIGMRSPVFGELVRAFVVLKPGATASAAEVRKHCAERLASFKVPHKVDFLDALPRNPSGKVVKRLLPA